MKFRFQALLLALFLPSAALKADWRDVIGFTRLQTLAGSELPTAQGLTQVEAPDASSNFLPDTTNTLFTGKSFTLKSGTSGISDHATHVATNYYSTTSQQPGTAAVDLYNANGWLGSGFLQTGSGNVPNKETRAVENHSWVGSTGTTSTDTEICRRLDFAINRDGFVCAVGSDNNGSTTLPILLCQAYNTISVGRDDGGHSAGLTTIDGSGRMKPEIVAPSAAPEYATSWTTPMVSGAAGMLSAKLSTSYAVTGADLPRVVKALLLATAAKDTLPSWHNTSTSPLDAVFGAGNLNIYHAYNALRTGKGTASVSVQQNPRGWAADTVNGTATKTYFLNIPAGAPSTPFCAALTWHPVVTETRSGPSLTWTSTLANLNLHLYHANGFTLGSLVTESLSTVDNVELVYQSALAPGSYAIVVENTSATSTAYGLAWHSLPAVTITASTPTAREIDGQQGVITLTRTGDTNLPLYVPLTIGGTAIPGTHYQTLPANVTIPAGQTSSTLQVIPVSDYIAEGDRSVTVAVAADFSLVRDPAQSAVVTIQDKPFDAWRFAHFTTAELNNNSISGANADPDADQLPNLVEYALGLAPKSPNTTPVRTTNTGGYLGLSADKNPGATDITWGAEVSSDLKTWSPAVITTNTTALFEARDNTLMHAAPKRFIRLKIIRP